MEKRIGVPGKQQQNSNGGREALLSIKTCYKYSIIKGMWNRYMYRQRSMEQDKKKCQMRDK